MSGILAGAILFGLFLAVAGAVLAVDYAGRKPARPAATPLQKQGREAA